ncbi:protein-export chaperone SecB [Lentzea tibetensis]|uniref:Protein-export chaperone SecB n=1 Tax=Lentzea tibetensis TaxID=2591470 RepID=A0A563EHM4_9PSEU|nr:protein-export chaperone SecB [Lentzea tibetensis]TWP45967.1 protein-export chaperone SecB [Lentzea tibetensis]
MTSLNLQEARHFAARIAARADIREVRLLESNFKLNRMPVNDHLVYKLEKDPQVEYSEGDGFFVITSRYSLLIAEVEHESANVPNQTEEGEEDVIAMVDFKLAGLFELNMREDDDAPRIDELMAYAWSMGNFALHPYAREYISNVTSRLGLPPLTINVLQLDYDPDKG